MVPNGTEFAGGLRCQFSPSPSLSFSSYSFRVRIQPSTKWLTRIPSADQVSARLRDIVCSAPLEMLYGNKSAWPQYPLIDPIFRMQPPLCFSAGNASLHSNKG